MPLKRLFRTLQFATLLMSSTYGVMFTMMDDYRDKYGISDSGLGLVLAVGFYCSTGRPWSRKSFDDDRILVGHHRLFIHGLWSKLCPTADRSPTDGHWWRHVTACTAKDRDCF